MLDQTGAAAPDVRVVLRSPEASAEETAITGNAGTFVFATVRPGTYETSVNEAGFEAHRRRGLVVTHGAGIGLDIVLAVAVRRDPVMVTESVAVVDSDAVHLGGHVASTAIRSLPVNGRSYTDLRAVQPGVTPASARQRGRW